MIWIAQVLCPSRHAIMALAFDRDDLTPEQASAKLIVTLENALRARTLRRECNICGSSSWRVEAGPTRFHLIEEARPELERLERENDMTRRFFAALKGVGR